MFGKESILMVVYFRLVDLKLVLLSNVSGLMKSVICIAEVNIGEWKKVGQVRII